MTDDLSARVTSIGGILLSQDPTFFEGDPLEALARFQRSRTKDAVTKTTNSANLTSFQSVTLIEDG